ncbi:sensor histidine kinase [Streptomyces stramineus]
MRRITAGLTPAALVEHGLLDATRTLAHRLSTDDVRVRVTGPPAPLPALAPGVETAAYRIAAEAVTNAARHARAHRVEVAFAATPTALTVTVTDDGRGFDAAAVPGTGLASVGERAEEIGGTSTITSGPDGTTVTATLPITPGPGPTRMTMSETPDGDGAARPWRVLLVDDHPLQGRARRRDRPGPGLHGRRPGGHR